MKIIFSLIAVIMFSSCAHKNQFVSDRIDLYDYKNKDLIELKVNEILANHSEFNQETKLKLKEVIFSALEENQKIKVEESKTAQLLLSVTLKDQASYEEISKVKKSMKKLYNDKYAVFERTANQLRKILDIKRENTAFLDEIEPFLHR